MQRYFVNSNNIDITNSKAFIDGNDFHHMKNVMKMRPGEKVILCVNTDNYLCVIDSFDKNRTYLKIIDHYINQNELNSYVSIAQGLVRKAKCDEVLRRLVELGAKEYFNVMMDFSTVKVNDDLCSYLERRKTIVKEASEQSERGELLNVKETMKFKEFLKYANEFDVKLVAYEESGRSDDNTLSLLKDEIKNKRIICLIGPEGGISLKEIELLKENGFKLVGLGKRILRTETAPLYLMSVLGFLIEY